MCVICIQDVNVLGVSGVGCGSGVSWSGDLFSSYLFVWSVHDQS